MHVELIILKISTYQLLPQNQFFFTISLYWIACASSALQNLQLADISGVPLQLLFTRSGWWIGADIAVLIHHPNT